MTVTARPAWTALAGRAETLRSTHLRELFAADPDRYEEIIAGNQRDHANSGQSHAQRRSGWVRRRG